MISITVITVVRESNWTGGSLLHSLVSHSLCGWTGENSMVTKGGIPTKKMSSLRVRNGGVEDQGNTQS